MMKITDEQRAELKRLRAAKQGRLHVDAKASRPPTRHDQTIVALCADLGLQRIGFRRAVKDQLTWLPWDFELTEEEWDAIPDDAFPEDDGRAPWEEVKSALKVRPDAYRIVNGEIHCYEVVDTCHMDVDRRFAYGDLWFAFDSHYVTVRLWICDVYGNRAAQDLGQWWDQDVLPRLQSS